MMNARPTHTSKIALLRSLGIDENEVVDDGNFGRDGYTRLSGVRDPQGVPIVEFVPWDSPAVGERAEEAAKADWTR